MSADEPPARCRRVLQDRRQPNRKWLDQRLLELRFFAGERFAPEGWDWSDTSMN